MASEDAPGLGSWSIALNEIQRECASLTRMEREGSRMYDVAFRLYSTRNYTFSTEHTLSYQF